MASPQYYSMTARTGREHQVYSADGFRMVAGSVILTPNRDHVLLISSTAHPTKLVIPKGGIETDESADFLQTAIRESWEEGGVELQGCQWRYLGMYRSPEPLPEDEKGKKKSRTEFHFYEFILAPSDIQNDSPSRIKSAWPESERRGRRWLSFTQAKDELVRNNRLELVQALELSSMVRS